jgi:hypothetical protein
VEGGFRPRKVVFREEGDDVLFFFVLFEELLEWVHPMILAGSVDEKITNGDYV